MSFAPLGLIPPLVDAAAAQGLHQPTPIQAQALPVLLAGRDLLALAPTGSGKTVAFALPLLQALLSQPRPVGQRTAGLVLVPTRELAVQVGAVLRGLVRQLPRPQAGLKVAVVFGGVSINPQLLALRGGADLVVATPGRLLDLMEHRALRLDAVRHLVLDEADRLLDLGFAQEWARIQAHLPPQVHTALFSATLGPEVQALVNTRLHNPVRLQVQAEPTPDPLIQQRAVVVDTARRTQALKHLMQAESWRRCLVFVATRYAAEHLASKLYRAGVYATALHGELSQGARQQVLDEFKDARWDVLVTTDLAARGIDVPQLPVVVNFDLPRSPTDHTHRIGRTGRAGANGLALTLVSPPQMAHWRLVAKRLGLDLPLEVLPGFEPRETEPPPSPGGGGIKGKRPSKKDKLRAAQAAASGPGPAPKADESTPSHNRPAESPRPRSRP